MEEQSLQQQNQQIQPTQDNTFEIKLFGDTSIADVIKESLASINKVEKETYDLFNETRESAKKEKAPEATLVYNEQAKGFLELISEQNRSRAEIIKAATSVIKAFQSPVQNNFNANIPPVQNENFDIKSIAKDFDPLKQTTNEYKVVTDKEESDEVKKYAEDDEIQPQLIVSPKYYQDMEKARLKKTQGT